MLKDETDYTRVFIAMLLAGLLLIFWQAQVEFPRRQALSKMAVQQSEELAKEKAKQAQELTRKESEENPLLTHEQRIAASPRIAIDSPTLRGSLALKGARFDDLRLAKYRETLDAGSPDVTLFSPSGDELAYFAQIGWLATDNTKVPDQHTLWQADKKKLSAGEPLRLTWNNGEGVTFALVITLDDAYMFTIDQQVENRSGHAISIAPYGYLNRTHVDTAQHNVILHEGPIGVLNKTLDEIGYQDVREKGNRVFENASGWLGITDKYWQAALIPGADSFKATFSHYNKNSRDHYQTDYVSEMPPLANGATASTKARLFAGAKEVQILDRYTNGDAANQPIPLFDRSVDFGMLYFLTKPMFMMLNAFFTYTGNFGIAIMLLTIVVKMFLYPMANKSYHATTRMRDLQPEMLKLRDKYFDDKIKLQQETMALYKREKVNPASGCLPIIPQMIIFFALYKVLFVTIEMRHAPFFGWIRDLSAADPSNIFTAFGLIPWATPHWLHLGILPIVYCITMVIQMRQQPKPTDPVQAKMMTFMPYFMLIIFASFPAGLVVYWTWSNILSILQQEVITKRHHAHMERKKAKAVNG